MTLKELGVKIFNMINCWAEKIYLHALATPDKVALVGESKLTYRQLWELSCGFANYLKNSGLQKGQVVICRALGRVEYVVVYVATLIAKGVFTPFDKEFTISKFSDQINQLPDVFCVIHNFSHTFGKDVNFDDVLTIADKYKSFDKVDFDLNDHAQILFTSGSTAKPKAVLMKNSQLLQGQDICDFLHHTKDSVVLVMSPMHHYAFFGLALPGFIIGGTVVLYDDFNFKHIVNLIVENKVTVMQATPSMMKVLSVLCKDKFGEIFASVRTFTVGGEFVPQPLKEWLKANLPTCKFYAIYGLTEMGFASCYRFDNLDKPFGCVGTLLPHVEIEIRHEEADVVAIKSPYAYKKYLGFEEHKDWFVTKDLSYFEDDHLFVLGRVDDVIVSGGTKINPFEIETVAKEFDGISQCVCVGVKDHFLGQVAKLYYLPTKEINLKDFKGFLAQKIEKACLPKVYEQIDQIRTTPTGKLDRKWYKNYEK